MQHSSIVGGSSAARVVNCPGSTALLASLPNIVNRDSVYSIEGTALHTAMEMLITGKVTLDKIAGAVIDTRSGPVTITPELVREALDPAWAYWSELAPSTDLWQLETVVQFPGIEGAFGTTDVLARDDQKNITYVSDWKFGSGEAVKATYPDASTPVMVFVNEQLMFYAAAARHTQPEFFPKDCRIVLTIVQPRARDGDAVTSVEVRHEDLDAFVQEMQEAVAIAAEPNAPTQKGRWCRFQACQTVCPHHTGPLFNLEMLAEKVPSVVAAPVQTVSLVDILNAAPAVESLIREARAQAHVLLADGRDVPGWKLVQKRGTRQWVVDEKTLARKLKLRKADLYETTLKSPAAVEKIIGKKDKRMKDLATMVSSGTTIAPTSDKRSAVAADPAEISKILLEILHTD
jgi:hypothetical protein